MNVDSRPRRRRQGRGGPCRDGAGQGYGRSQSVARGADGNLAARTATRAVVALGAYVVQDLRDPYGVARPRLRRTALRMSSSRREGVRRLGAAYLRSDPPTPEELESGPPTAQQQLPPPVGYADVPAARVSREAMPGAAAD